MEWVRRGAARVEPPPGRASPAFTVSIDVSTRTRDALSVQTTLASAGALLEAPAPAPRGEDDALFQARALSIAAHIRENALRTRAGDVVWMMEPAEPGEARKPMDPHLYSGSTGTAFFLAALDHARGTGESREVVVAALAPLRRLLAALHADPARAAQNRMPVGVGVGIGSFVYGLLRIGQWLGDEGMVADAHRAAALLTPERIAADPELDVMRGAAGAILALLALDAAVPDAVSGGETPLTLAGRCAEHLLTHRASHHGAPRAWFVAGQPPRSGFAHGASGIGHALLRLYARTGDERLRDAAMEGFAYERHLYDPQTRNWDDPFLGRPLQLQSWCFGAPGVALARLEAVRSADGPEMRADLAEALDVAAGYRDEPVDHLCCGNFGRAEILAVAARQLDQPGLMRTARGIARRALERCPAETDFGLIPPGTAPMLRLALFRGIAGIGYVLTRLAHPDARLPTPLAME